MAPVEALPFTRLWSRAGRRRAGTGDERARRRTDALHWGLENLIVEDLGAPASDQQWEPFSGVLKFIFSGLLLAAASIVFGGQWLARCLHLPRDPKAKFTISIPRVLTIEATGHEVGLGFTGFIATLLVISMSAGAQAYQLTKDRLGVDLGQFNSLCVLSAFTMLVWSSLVLILIVQPWKSPDPLLEKQRQRLDRVDRESDRHPSTGG